MRFRLATLATTLAVLAPAASAHAGFYAAEPIDGPTPDVLTIGDVDVARDGNGAVAYLRRDGGVSHVFVSSDPSVDMSIHGTAFATFSSSGDLKAARLDRTSTSFTVVDGILDINGADVVGTGDNRARVAVAADGTGVAVWGEAGHVYARRLFSGGISQSPVDLTVPDLAGHAGGVADAPDVDIEDDSSFAWIAFRQRFDDGGVQKPRGIARRLRGSRVEDPAVIDGQDWGGEGSAIPDVDINGKGEGLATAGSAVSGTAFSSILKDDIFNPGVPIGGGGAPSLPKGAIAETTDRVVGYLQNSDGTVHARFYDDKPNVRTVPTPGADTVVSTADFGPVDPQAGFDVASNRQGDVVMVFVQGTGDSRRLVSAVWDRAPGAFSSYTSSRWRNAQTSPLSWGAAPDLWGPLTYTLMIDGRPVPNVSTQDTKVLLPPGAVPDGQHTWRVVATDRRGQATTTTLKPLRLDATPPKVTFSAKKRGRALTITAKAADVLPPSGKAAGVKYVRIDFGDGSRFVQARKATHRYRRTGKFSIKVSATDEAGNVSVARRSISVGK
jgi:hypothetical protein